MKKLIFGMLLALTAGVFTSCQKGENFFNGTWQAVGTYWYEDKKGNEFRDVYTVELTLGKKDGSASYMVDYPKEPKRDIKRTGTYTYYNENTIAVTLKPTNEEDEWVFLLYRDAEDNSRIYGNDYSFTRIKGDK